MKSVYQSL